MTIACYFVIIFFMHYEEYETVNHIRKSTKRDAYRFYDYEGNKGNE